ncbi:MAG: SpoIIE family protein phosphatase [Candidatus Ozemobacteraceae bacterium]
MNKNLEEIIQQIDPPNFYAPFFRAIHKRICSRSITSVSIEKVWRETTQRFHLPFEPYYFDASGTLITPLSVPIRERKIMQTCWNIFRKIPVKDGDDKDKEIESLLGDDYENSRLELQKGKTLPIFGQAGNGLLFWDSGPRNCNDGALIAVWDCPSPLVLLNKKKKALKNIDFSLISRDSEKELHVHRAFLSSNEDLEKFSKRNNLEKGSAETDWMWVEKRMHSIQFFAGKPFSRAAFTTRKNLCDYLILFLGGFVGWLGYYFFYKNEGIYISLRVKLSLLFLYITFISTMGLASLGFAYLHDREEVLSSQTIKDGQEVLTQLDLSFSKEKRASLKFFRRFRDGQPFRTNMEQVKNKAILMERDGRVSWLEVRDLNANILFTTEAARVTQKIGLVGAFIAKRVIENFLQDRISPSQTSRPNPAEVIVSNILESPMAGIGKIFERPDVIQEVKFGRFDLLWYWDVLRDPTHPAALIQANQRIEGIANRFLVKRIRWGHEQREFKVFAWHKGKNIYIPQGFTPTLPFKNFMQKVLLSREFMSDIISIDGKEFLAIGLPAKQIKNYVLAALFPQERISRKIAAIRETIFGGIAFALLLSLLIGWILSDAFLIPIKELSRGVKALHERDSSIRIPDLKKDEFGDLAQNFNRTIEEIKELLYAQEIQGRLIPQQLPDVDGYEMAFANLTATDLGGDYCDVVTLNDGRVLFVIGDVTGHGVSSALVMAMAKSAVFSYCQEAGSLVTLMTRMNHLFCQLLKRKKLMTFFSALLDPVTGRLVVSNAGHPWPFLFKTNGEVEKLQVCHAPLGFSERGEPFEEKEFFLEPGSVLVYYTDGIIEMVDPRNNAYGNKKFLEFFRNRKEQKAEELKKALILEARNFVGVTAFDDDVTFIILKRM